MTKQDKLIEIYKKYVKNTYLQSYWEIERRNEFNKFQDILPYNIKNSHEELFKEISKVLNESAEE